MGWRATTEQPLEELGHEFTLWLSEEPCLTITVAAAVSLGLIVDGSLKKSSSRSGLLERKLGLNRWPHRYMLVYSLKPKGW